MIKLLDPKNEGVRSMYLLPLFEYENGMTWPVCILVCSIELSAPPIMLNQFDLFAVSGLQ